MDKEFVLENLRHLEDAIASGDCSVVEAVEYLQDFQTDIEDEFEDDYGEEGYDDYSQYIDLESVYGQESAETEVAEKGEEVTHSIMRKYGSWGLGGLGTAAAVAALIKFGGKPVRRVMDRFRKGRINEAQAIKELRAVGWVKRNKKWVFLGGAGTVAAGGAVAYARHRRDDRDRR